MEKFCSGTDPKLDVSMRTFADHDAQLEAIEVSLEDVPPRGGGRAGPDDQITAKAQIDLAKDEDCGRSGRKGS